VKGPEQLQRSRESCGTQESASSAAARTDMTPPPRPSLAALWSRPGRIFLVRASELPSRSAMLGRALVVDVTFGLQLGRFLPESRGACCSSPEQLRGPIGRNLCLPAKASSASLNRSEPIPFRSSVGPGLVDEPRAFLWASLFGSEDSPARAGALFQRPAGANSFWVFPCRVRWPCPPRRPLRTWLLDLNRALFFSGFFLLVLDLIKQVVTCCDQVRLAARMAGQVVDGVCRTRRWSRAA